MRALIRPTSSAQNVKRRSLPNPSSSDSLEARAPGETDIEGSFLAGLNPSFKLIPGLSPNHCRVVWVFLSLISDFPSPVLLRKSVLSPVGRGERRALLFRLSPAGRGQFRGAKQVRESLEMRSAASQHPAKSTKNPGKTFVGFFSFAMSLFLLCSIFGHVIGSHSSRSQKNALLQNPR